MRQRRLKKPTDAPGQQEVEAAEMIGGRRHSGSGASDYRKSDASSSDLQLEAKQTVQRSMALQVSWLEKISREAGAERKAPMMHLRFLAAAPDTEKDWVVLPASVFKAMLAAARKQGFDARG